MTRWLAHLDHFAKIHCTDAKHSPVSS